MTMQALTALFDTRAEADRAADNLAREAGVPREQITVIAQEATGATGGGSENTGFWASLKDMFGSDDDRHAYSEAIRRGGFLLTARVEEAGAERAMDVLEAQGGVDMEGREQSWREEGWTGREAGSAAQTMPDGSVVTTAATATTPARTPAGAAPATAARSAAGDETIPLVEERLRVGKRAVAGGRVRVRSYVVETPVEEQVTLRDETVSIERRTVDRAPTPADEALFGERTIEATETDEEAVVSKTARVTEELVVRKGVEDRVETVRDTVRRTEVEVDDDRATTTGAGAAARPATPGASATAPLRDTAKPGPR